MLYRFESQYLIDWLVRSDRKPLLIKGARQVGKSTIVKQFAKKSNLTLVELDFEQNPGYAALFTSKDPETILTLLSAHFNQQIEINSSLLFLDEIQKTPEVISCLRYFYEKMPSLPIIAAGSLLDLALQHINFSIPVGRVEYMYLGPMNFENFLLATKQKPLYDFLQQYEPTQTIPEPLHNSLLNSVKNYFIVGGMPQAVANYANNHDFIALNRLHNSLLTGFKEDFSKYASKSEQERMRLLFNKIPIMLGKKFIYSQIDREEKSTTIKTALDNLSLARIINVVYHTNANGLPLGSEVNSKKFKTFFLDIGLVTTALDLNILTFNDVEDLSLINSGQIAEQFVAQELLQLRELYQQPNLYYWIREAKSSSAEVDFIIGFNGKVIPVEVKAGMAGKLRSLHYFLNEKNSAFAIRFSNNPISSINSTVQIGSESLSYQLLSVPFYLIGQLRRLLHYYAL